MGKQHNNIVGIDKTIKIAIRIYIYGSPKLL
jgi:hypothetical protein